MKPTNKFPITITLEELSDAGHTGYCAEVRGPIKDTIMSDNLKDLFIEIEYALNDHRQ